MQDHITFATLIITGPDAERFLQGQLTCDVTKVTTEPSFGAYCDARGRMIANFILIKNDHAFHLMLPDNMLDILEHTLKKFAVFSKVTLTKNSKTRHTNIETHKLALIKKGLAFIYPETSTNARLGKTWWCQLYERVLRRARDRRAHTTLR